MTASPHPASARPRLLWLLALLALLATALPTALPAAAQTSGMQQVRMAGATRTGTAAAVAETLFPAGAAEAILVSATRYQEALPGAALAGRLSAPVLLTPADRLDPATARALASLGVQRVTVLGDPAVIGDDVVEALAERYEVRRIAGSDEYGTAEQIARETLQLSGGLPLLDGHRTILLASGQDFPDALAASGPAHSGGMPLLLTRRGSLPDATRALLDEQRPDEVLIFGGTSAVSRDVEDAITAMGITVRRLAGDTRTGTAATSAEHFTDLGLFRAGAAVLVRGDAFPDDLTAASVAGVHRAPILLAASPDALSEETVTWFTERCGLVDVLFVIGGTAAVSEAVTRTAGMATDCDTPPPSGGGQPDEPAVPGVPGPPDPPPVVGGPGAGVTAYPGQPGVGSVYWGAAVDGNADPADRHEIPAGHPLSVRRTFFQWHQRTTSLVTTATTDLATDRLPWVSVKTPSWAAMAEGTHDAEIDEMLTALDALGGPVWLTIHHEPEGGGGVNSPDDPAGPAGHLAMNQRVRQRMTALGTDNIALAIILMDWTWDPRSGRDPDQWWAPDTYDILGVDVYRETPGSLITDNWYRVRRWAADNGTDIAVGEWGMRGSDTTAGDHVREWYEHAATSATDGNGARITALAAFDSGLNAPTGSWELTGHQLTTFHQLLTDPRTATP